MHYKLNKENSCVRLFYLLLFWEDRLTTDVTIHTLRQFSRSVFLFRNQDLLWAFHHYLALDVSFETPIEDVSLWEARRRTQRLAMRHPGIMKHRLVFGLCPNSRAAVCSALRCAPLASCCFLYEAWTNLQWGKWEFCLLRRCQIDGLPLDWWWSAIEKVAWFWNKNYNQRWGIEGRGMYL